MGSLKQMRGISLPQSLDHNGRFLRWNAIAEDLSAIPDIFQDPQYKERGHRQHRPILTALFDTNPADAMAKMNRYNLLCIIYVTFGSFFYGYDSGCTTSIFGYPSFISYFKFDAVKLGAFGSVYYGGNFIGNMANLYLPDRFGRLRTIQFASVLSILGAGLQTGASNFGILMGGRVIGGVACGIVYTVCPLYASEISPPEFRGRVGGLYRLVPYLFFSKSWADKFVVSTSQWPTVLPNGWAWPFLTSRAISRGVCSLDSNSSVRPSGSLWPSSCHNLHCGW